MTRGDKLVTVPEGADLERAKELMVLFGPGRVFVSLPHHERGPFTVVARQIGLGDDTQRHGLNRCGAAARNPMVCGTPAAAPPRHG